MARVINRYGEFEDEETTTPTPTTKPDPKDQIPDIIKKPTKGLILNPVTPQKLAEIAARWQTMSQPERDAATRNQAAALRAQEVAQARTARDKAMREERAQLLKDRRKEALDLQRRQEREYKKDRQQFNRDLTNRQARRVLAQQTLRANRADRLKIQRAREAEATKKQRDWNTQRAAILAANRRRDQINAANTAKAKAANVRRSIIQGKAQGVAGARNYFAQQGAKYAPYAKSVNDAIKQLVSTLNPGEMLSRDLLANVGEDVFTNLQQQGRARAQSTLQPYTTPGYESTALGDESINPTLEATRRQHFDDAQAYIDRLLNRGVITQPGYNKALENLQGQVGKVDVQLRDIGNTILAGGRQKLTDIINKAGTAAGNLPLGKPFSAAPYASQLQQAIKSFQTSLPGQIDTQIMGPLFDTTKLANIAGMASGAQNTNFDPYALKGIAKPANPMFDNSVGMRSVF